MNINNSDSDETIFLNEIVIDYLNDDSNCLELTNENMGKDIKDDSIDRVEFRSRILHSSKINDNCYRILVKSFRKIFRIIKFDKIDQKKLNILLDLNVIDLTHHNIDGIREEFPNRLLELIIGKQNKLQSLELTHVNFTEKEFIEILNSKKIELNNKIYIIDYVNTEKIIDSENFLNSVFEVYVDNNYSGKIDLTLYKSFYKRLSNKIYLQEKIKLLANQINNLEEEVILYCLKYLSGDYFKLTISKKKPSFEKNENNLKLLQKLESLNIIYPIKDKYLNKESEKILVVVK